MKTENRPLSFPNGERVIKSVVQVTGVAAGVLVGIAASAAFSACATASAPLLVGGAAFIGVTYVGTKIIDVASQYYYDGVGIE